MIKLASIFLVFSFISYVPAQTRYKRTIYSRKATPGDRRERVRVVEGQPTIYMALERQGDREPLRNGESRNGIWLRLFNNTRWPIRLDMSDVPSDDYGDAELFYDVMKGKQLVWQNQCHACSTNLLTAGQSLLFSVPRETVENGKALRISYSYDWEADDKGSDTLEPTHYVFFRQRTKF